MVHSNVKTRPKVSSKCQKCPPQHHQQLRVCQNNKMNSKRQQNEDQQQNNKSRNKNNLGLRFFFVLVTATRLPG